MKIHRSIIPVILLTLVVGATVVSGQSEWRKLGVKEVSHNVDHDTITANDDDFTVRELRISVKKAPVKFTRVVLNYKDGMKQELEFLEDVQIGKESRSITIEGDGHVIKSIDFWYETDSLGGKKAKVTVHGRG